MKRNRVFTQKTTRLGRQSETGIPLLLVAPINNGKKRDELLCSSKDTAKKIGDAGKTMSSMHLVKEQHGWYDAHFAFGNKEDGVFKECAS